MARDGAPEGERAKRIRMIGAAGVALAAAAAVIWIPRGGDAPAESVRVAGGAMSTSYSVEVIPAESPSASDRRELAEAVKRQLERVDVAMSRFREGSEISRLNRSGAGVSVAVSPDTAEVVGIARRLSETSGGAFDVTVAPLVRLWGFGGGPRQSAEPSPDRLARARERVGYRLLEVDPERAILSKARADLEVDLSGIAKGWAVDRIALALEGMGYSRYLVEVGGEIRARGDSARGAPWRVAIERPPEEGEGRRIHAVLELDGQSMATSGDYRSFFVLDGRRYSHTIDPRTGRPVAHGLASVSVVHRDCVWADGLATALTVMGPDEGFALADGNGLPALFLSRAAGGRLDERSTRAFDAFRSRKDPPRIVRGSVDQ